MLDASVKVPASQSFPPRGQSHEGNHLEKYPVLIDVPVPSHYSYLQLWLQASWSRATHPGYALSEFLTHRIHEHNTMLLILNHETLV